MQKKSGFVDVSSGLKAIGSINYLGRAPNNRYRQEVGVEWEVHMHRLKPQTKRRDPDLHGAEPSQQEKYIESLGKIDL